MSLIARLWTMLRRPHGGTVIRRIKGDRPIMLSPSRQITDADEAESLGLTATARWIRRTPTA